MIKSWCEIKRIVELIVVLTAVLTACRPARPAVVFTPVSHQHVEVAQTPDTIFDKPEPVIERFRDSVTLGLVMPFYFEENFPESVIGDSVEIDPRSKAALQFYEGALIAADSLRAAGVHFSIHVSDNGNDSLAYHWMLMNYSWLKKNDFNFIQYPSNQCDAVAQTAGHFHIPLIIAQCSPLSDSLNSFTAVAAPSTITQCRQAVKLLAKKFPMQKFIVMARSTGIEDVLAGYFTDALNEFAPERFSRISPSDTASWVKKVKTSTDEIVYILASSDEYFVTANLNSIDRIGRNLTVIGLPTWDNFETVFLGGFKNLDVICFNSMWLDFNDAEVLAFRNKYVQSYFNDITWNAWNGYCMVIKLARSVYYKTSLDALKALFPSLPNGGYENNDISLIRYSGFDTITLDLSE